MNRMFSALLLLALSQSVFADGLNEDDICKYTGSSWHDVECSNKRFNAVEEVLNLKYKELMSIVDGNIASEPERLKDLKEKYIHAQRAWVKFREKECSAYEVWYTRGTLQKSYYYNCMKNMAYQRIKEFENFANPGK